MVAARVGLRAARGAVFRAVALHPQPGGAGALRIHEDEEILDGMGGDAFPKRLLGFRIREGRGGIGGCDLEHAETGELGDFHGDPSLAFEVKRHGFPRVRIAPAEILDEEIGKAECLQVIPGGAGVELGGHGKRARAASSERVSSGQALRRRVSSVMSFCP